MAKLDDVFNLADVVASVAARDPQRIAVIEPAGGSGNSRRYRKHTYQELSSAAESVAVGFREIGIGERTRTVFMASPSFQAAAAAVALTRVGATFVMIDPSVGYRNVAERLRRVQPEAFVGLPFAQLGRMIFGWGPRLMDRAVTVGGSFPGTRSLESLKRKAPAQPAAPQVGPDDVAAILYTTGSTGPAKPTAYLHRNYAAVHTTAHRGWGFAERDEVPVDLVAFPAFMSVALSFGGTCVVPPINFARQGPADVDPAALAEVINDCKVNTFFASPALLERLANHANSHGIALPTLRRVIGGGAPLFPPLMRDLLQVMEDGAEVCANYGATEALPSTELNSNEVFAEGSKLTEPGKGICVGRPFPGIEVRVVPVGPDVLERISASDELPVGELGELVVTGPNISPSYFEEPGSTKKNKAVDEEGRVWHRLGDIGYRDDEGRLWVVGRVSHRIRTANGDLAPMHAETLIDSHPAVRRSGLVGVPRGESQIPVACVELKKPLGAEELVRVKAEILGLLENNPLTREVRHLLFPKKLPVDPRHNAKIERPRLAQWAAKQKLG